ncbi:MAG: RNase adapter RapZ, partial [Synergistaceae bacterium]|nr:RNase adapter RapZ [Synergistaceae bacterium]
MHNDSEKKIIFSSFGFKYGIPEDANYIFDVRFIPNPYYIAELRPLSGKDKKVQDFLFSYEETNELISNCIQFLDYIIPAFINSERSVNIAIGCTGGRHRSVVFTERLFSHYEDRIRSLNEA